MQPPTPQRLAELEDLAALIDGRLTGERRERALASLDFNEDDQELMAEALAVMAEVDCGDAETDDEKMYGREVSDNPVIPPGSVAGKGHEAVPMPQWLRAPWLLAAAALLVAVTVWVVVPKPSLEGRIAKLEYSKVQGRLGEMVWGVMRGPGDPEPATGRQGSLHVDLLVALRAGDAERAQSVLHALKNEMGEGLEWAAWYQEVEQALQAGRPPAELIGTFDDKQLDSLKEEPGFKNAQCLRTAMLAAIQGSAEFFADDGLLKECPVLEKDWPADSRSIDFPALEAKLRESLREATAHP